MFAGICSHYHYYNISTSFFNHVTKSSIISKVVHLIAIPANIYLFKVNNRSVCRVEKGVKRVQS